ncbi:rRNA maturation RNase YbeY [Amaricoccus tamworthensis]|uniref:rRNA maturation RNase YbeY n=1 Tax=Amaricoccus tamworthensis TaxID=57002 RepID=UPI003C7A24A1
MSPADTGPVDLVVEDSRWEAVGLEDLADRAAVATLTEMGRDPMGHEISLLACDDARIRTLNGEFRGKDAETNVLSWPAFEGDIPRSDPTGLVFLGDIAISFDTCEREARDGGKRFEGHVSHLIVHGIMHLLGFDHVEDAEAYEMERIEANILATLDIANPY